MSGVYQARCSSLDLKRSLRVMWGAARRLQSYCDFTAILHFQRVQTLSSSWIGLYFASHGECNWHLTLMILQKALPLPNSKGEREVSLGHLATAPHPPHTYTDTPVSLGFPWQLSNLLLRMLLIQKCTQALPTFKVNLAFLFQVFLFCFY